MTKFPIHNCTIIKSNAIIFFDDPLRLSGLTAALSVCEQALPDREKLLPVFEALLILIEHIKEQEEIIWIATYIRWEIGFLGALGFSLELSNCTVTGTNDDLSFVSPKTGRAVSKEIGLKYSDNFVTSSTINFFYLIKLAYKLFDEFIQKL